MPYSPPTDTDTPTDPDTATDTTSCDTATAAPWSYLLNESTAHSYEQQITATAQHLADTIAHTKRPFTGVSPQSLAETLAGIDLEQPLHDTTAALTELESVYLNDAVYFHHPRYLAHLNCPTVIPAAVGETVLSTINSSLDTWEQSAGATLIEQRLIEWTTRRLQLGRAADGVFTSGGTQSNLQALLLARDETRHAMTDGSTDTGTDTDTAAQSALLPRLRILTSECSHFSVTKAASLLGMGADAVIAIPCDEERRMRPAALERALARCHEDGTVPMAVVATAGTTDFGSIDPLGEIAPTCAQWGVWLHVDAAYGGGLLASEHHRHLLDGISGADSVTVDYHKSFFQPLTASAVLVRDAATLRHVTYHADYLNPAARDGEQPVPNQVDKSIQTSRRFDALKLWLTLRVMGANQVGMLFDSVIDLAGRVWETLAADSRFDVVTRPQLSTLVFRYAPSEAPDAAADSTTAHAMNSAMDGAMDCVVDAAALDRANEYARDELAGSGEAVVASTVADGRTHLKFTLLNPRTTLGDVEQILDLLAGHAQHYLTTTAGTTRD